MHNAFDDDALALGVPRPLMMGRGFLFTAYRYPVVAYLGMASIGKLAILGILLTLGTALFLVPAIITCGKDFRKVLLKKWMRIKNHPNLHTNKSL